MIITGDLAKRQIDVDSDGVEREEEGEEEILDEVAGQNTAYASSLGNLRQMIEDEKSEKSD